MHIIVMIQKPHLGGPVAPHDIATRILWYIAFPPFIRNIPQIEAAREIAFILEAKIEIQLI